MDRIAELIEAAEAEAVWGYENSAPPAVAESLGLASRRIAGGVVLAMPGDVTNYWSKALGFGFESPVTLELVEQIIDFYRAHGVRQATLQFAPSVLPADWEAIREKTGLSAGGTWLKLARLAGLVESADTDLRIGQVEPEQAEEWATTLTRGFGMPVDKIVPMVTGVSAGPASRRTRRGTGTRWSELRRCRCTSRWHRSRARPCCRRTGAGARSRRCSRRGRVRPRPTARSGSAPRPESRTTAGRTPR